MIALAGIGAECRVTDFTSCPGQSSRALQRQRRSWVTLRDGCIMPRYVLAGMLAGVMLQHVGFPARHSSHEGSAYKWAVRRREAISFVTALLGLSQPSENQPPLNGQWLQHRGWAHNNLSSSFTSLVFCQHVLRASLTAVPCVCPCDHFLGDSCPFISIGLLVCRVWIYWHRWKKNPKPHLFIVRSFWFKASHLASAGRQVWKDRKYWEGSSNQEDLWGNKAATGSALLPAGYSISPRLAAKRLFRLPWDMDWCASRDVLWERSLRLLTVSVIKCCGIRVATD